MVRARQLNGRTVVDMEAAEKLGRLDKIIFDPAARRVVGFLVARNIESLFRPATHLYVPAAAVHAIGPDAVTVRHGAPDTDYERLENLPRVSDFIGRTVISESGRWLGRIDDVLISGADGRIVGYELVNADVMAKVEALFRNRRDEQRVYLRADRELRIGPQLIVAPEDAIGVSDFEQRSAPPAAPAEASRFQL